MLPVELTKSLKKRLARLPVYQNQSKNKPAPNANEPSAPTATAGTIKIVRTVVEVIGIEKPFRIRDLDKDVKDKLCSGLGIDQSIPLTPLQVGQSLGLAMRSAKEESVYHPSYGKVVLMSKPNPGTLPSSWCVLRFDPD